MSKGKKKETDLFVVGLNFKFKEKREKNKLY